MNKGNIALTLFIAFLSIALYMVARVDNLDEKVQDYLDTKKEVQNLQEIIYSSIKDSETNESSYSFRNNSLAYTNKGFISEEINGVSFDNKIMEIASYADMIGKFYTYDELIEAAEKVNEINIHEYYIPYRDKVRNKLKIEARKIEQGASQYDKDYIEWLNKTKIELFDELEACFKESGIEYQRDDDLHISWVYYKNGTRIEIK